MEVYMGIINTNRVCSVSNKLDLIPWVHWQSIPVITNNDGDGIASMLFLLNHPLTREKAVMKGLYTLDKLFLENKSDKYLVKDMVGIDLEMQIKGMHCLGHHMNITYNPNSLNANDLFGVSEDLLKNFQSKCPLNTLILLYWLFDEKPKNDREIAFLVYWDSVIWNYQEYRANATEWLKALEMNEILEALQNRRENLMKIIQTEILPLTNPFRTGYEKSKLPQCNITPFYDREKKRFYFPQNQSPKSIDRVLYLMNQLMGWDTSAFLTTFNFRENYVYTTLAVDGKFQDFKRQLANIQDKFISSAVTSKQKFRVTTKYSIEKDVKECGLIISNHGVYQKKSY